MADEEQAGASLQRTLLRLVRFWTDEGCLLLPSCDFEVDAATLHPETFFRLLAAEPWRAAYLQPVRRPLDGRRSDHPFRLSKHLQFQVILKPPPDDVQRLYLRSLEAAGCELGVHDLRFADWSWESPALGALGAGWHALVDGLGITRLTYLLRLAGRDLEPVGVELSYGLERLSMLLAGAPTAGDLLWAEGGPDYGALRRSDEAEFSRYVFEVADVAAARRRLDDLEGEARRCLASSLARPAYELAVKALQEIEILGARGDLAARERHTLIARVGEVVAAAAELYLEERQEETAAAAVETAAPEAEEETSAQESATEPEPEPEKKKRRRKTRTRKTRKARKGGETADGG